MTPDSALISHAQSVRQFMARTLDGTLADPPAVQEEFNRLALAGFALQQERNPIYQRWGVAAGVKQGGVTKWTEIPALPVVAFKEYEITCLTPAERTREFHSSGTTGQQPSRHFHHAASLELYEASLVGWFRSCVGRRIPSGTKFLFLAPPPAQAPHSSLVHMFETLSREKFASAAQWFGGLDSTSAWIVDTDALLAELRSTIATGTPVMLFGTAFNYVHVLDDLARQSRTLTLPVGSLVLETGGYKGRSRELPKAELHALIAARLGVPPEGIVCEYGMSELSSQAYELTGADGTRVFQFPPWARTSILSPETGREVADGEPGLLCIHDLANVWSASALRTQDLARRRGEGFELLGRAASAEARGCSLMSLGG